MTQRATDTTRLAQGYTLSHRLSVWIARIDDGVMQTTFRPELPAEMTDAEMRAFTAAVRDLDKQYRLMRKHKESENA